MADLELASLLANEGFTTIEGQRAAREALEMAGLTTARKVNINATKLSRVRLVLDAQFARACPNAVCRAALAGSNPSRTLIVVAHSSCQYCGGSDNLRAGKRFVALAAERRLRRVVVVGGSPSTRMELDELTRSGIELRMVDGTARVTGDRALRDLEWAQLVLVWGGTQLDHKVSSLYTDTQSPHRRKVITSPRRGVASLLDAASMHLERTDSRADGAGAQVG